METLEKKPGINVLLVSSRLVLEGKVCRCMARKFLNNIHANKLQNRSILVDAHMILPLL